MVAHNLSYFESLGGRGVACELLTSAYCNMECKYCYIPKVPGMADMHKEVVAKLQDPTDYIAALRRMYGDNLEHLSFWGTEPTLILQYLTPHLELFIRSFPKLKNFSFSTNFLSHYTRVSEFILEMERISKMLLEEGDKRRQKNGNYRDDPRFMIDVQISLDGPHFITDAGRQEGATDKIVANYRSFLKTLSENKLEHVLVKSHFKPTVGVEHLSAMNGDVTLIDEYFTFFNHVRSIAEEYLPTIHPYFETYLVGNGTLMVPGTYTSSDGRTFAHYLRNLKYFANHLINHPKYNHYNRMPSEYVNRFENFLRAERENPAAPSQNTCSGGDSNYGIDHSNRLHICHRSFYMKDERYLQAIRDAGGMDNWDVSLFEDGKIEHVKKNLIVDVDDESERTRFLTVMRGFHDYTHFKSASIFSITKWLAKCGQAEHRFLEDDHYCHLFSKFLVFVFGCSIENALNTTSVHITPVSMIRMFANGAFALILEDYFEQHPDDPERWKLGL